MIEQLIGQTLGRYHIDSLIGEGGMGAVFRAYDEMLQRNVAIKVLSPQFIRQPNFRDRFLQEARTAAKLRHPSIVQVFDFGQAPSLLYIVMEYIPGDNLHELLRKLKADDKRIILSEAVQLANRVSLAIDYAHRRGVLHRDIKPSNIMLRDEPSEGLPYQPILTDLGLAKLAEGGVVTQVGSTMGTPTYMSPEQALGDSTDERSDVYSLGILMYELATGQPPFKVKTITEAIRYHTKEPPPPPSSLRSELPVALERSILKALEKKPHDRFANAKAYATALKEVLPEILRLEQAPVAATPAVSLLTQYQPSLAAKPLRDPREAFREPPPSEAQDRLLILMPDQTTKTMLLQPGELTIGRDPSSDLVLAQSKVSRAHARVDYDGREVRVTDLNSTNGTTLNEAKLLPDIPEIWTPGSLLRIGDVWLRLERGRQPEKPAASAIDQTDVESGVIQTSPGTGRVGIFIEASRFAVSPGGSITIAITIFNQGRLVDHFHIATSGIPEEWIADLPEPIHLLPGQQQATSFTIQPPLSAESLAGEHPFSIKVGSQADPNQVAELKATLTVGSFYRFTLDLRPRKRTGVKEVTYRLVVTNMGNTGLDLEFEALGHEDSCRYTVEPGTLTVAAGLSAEARLRVQSKRPLRADETRRHYFTVLSRPVGKPELAQQVQGEWEQRLPTLDLSLQPERQRSTMVGNFTVAIKNLSESELLIRLDGRDQDVACLYSFQPAEVRIQPDEESVVRLSVESRRPLQKEMARSHRFTVSARADEAPGMTCEATGEWEQIPPTFTIEHRPEKQSGTLRGRYAIRLVNHSDANLTVNLQALEADGECSFSLDPPQVRIRPGQEELSYLTAAAKSLLNTDAARKFAFTIAARPIEAPGVVRQVRGEWTQVPPAFELSLQPNQLTSRTRAAFTAHIKNSSDADLTMHLEAADAQSACHFAFEPGQMRLSPGMDRAAQLVVTSKSRLRGKEPQSHPFTVSVRPTEAPQILRQIQAEWEQLPGGRPLGLALFLGLFAWLLLIGMWAFGWAIMLPLFFDLLEPSLEPLFGWSAAGIVGHGLGAFTTGVALRLAEPSYRLRHAFTIATGWVLSWVLLTFAASTDLIDVFLADALLGVIGGLIIGWTLRRTDLAFSWGKVLVLVLTWAAAWLVIGLPARPDFIFDSACCSILGEILGSTFLGGALAGALFGAIGGLVTLWQIGRARRALE